MDACLKGFCGLCDSVLRCAHRADRLVYSELHGAQRGRIPHPLGVRNEIGAVRGARSGTSSTAPLLFKSPLAVVLLRL